jgi:transcriptional regulator with XRE-family HTH domain
MMTSITSTQEIGALIKKARKESNLKQSDIAGLMACGNRFIIEAENGKPTMQAQKMIDLLNLVGLEIVIRKK